MRRQKRPVFWVYAGVWGAFFPKPFYSNVCFGGFFFVFCSTLSSSSSPSSSLASLFLSHSFFLLLFLVLLLSFFLTSIIFKSFPDTFLLSIFIPCLCLVLCCLAKTCLSKAGVMTKNGVFFNNPLFSKISKDSVSWFACFVSFQVFFSENNSFIVVSDKFQTAKFDKRAILMVRFWPNLMVRFWPFQETNKMKIGPEPDHQCVNFFWGPSPKGPKLNTLAV